MRKCDWKRVNRELVKRGSLTFFIDKACLSQPAKRKKMRGRPKLYTHPLIQLLLILKIQYRLTYRALEGFAKSLLPFLQSEHVSLFFLDFWSRLRETVLLRCMHQSAPF
ncbi:MAG: transposase [Chlamydiota bacterium]